MCQFFLFFHVLFTSYPFEVDSFQFPFSPSKFILLESFSFLFPENVLPVFLDTGRVNDPSLMHCL